MATEVTAVILCYFVEILTPGRRILRQRSARSLFNLFVPRRATRWAFRAAGTTIQERYCEQSIRMFLLSKPAEQQIRQFLSSQCDQPFSYPDACALELPVPRGYNADHNRIKLGEGQQVFTNAVEAIKRWEMFNIGWLQLCWPDTPIEAGSTIAVLVHHVGLWSLNACRIVSVIDEDGDIRRYGFIYGTLPDHAERGQERFTVGWRRKDDSVWYDILAHSRTNQLIAKLGYPVTRLLQKRFARDSMKAMARCSE